ncbi:uncharacterized protein C16orf78 homolog isoform X1 [Ochotona curzoniae]|uniref:uncharacterized protein C16orf78 homolog isoform X1 n=1 Tax=Ochotona curzoniae TaxID=130825 RepID=UPI001B352B46|nr:uncharacterized protein C16orf78 homolog isoform X1 [Ochotona curzoniae]
MEEEVEEPRRRSMPVERKSMWKTAEERRLSDLTRVLEWLERRQGRRQQTMQKQKNKKDMPPKTNEKEQKKGKGVMKQKGGTRKVSAKKQRNESPISTYRLYSFDQKGKRLSTVSGTFSKENTKKSDLDIKDAISLESTQRPNPFRRQSSVLDPFLQDSTFSNRRATLLRDWTSKAPDSSYERKLKSLMEKGNEPKVEAIKMLKPEEVLSCRYLRLSKNNIRTLLKLCRDAGLNVDIHPHMIEGEIDMKKIFTGNPNIAL